MSEIDEESNLPVGRPGLLDVSRSKESDTSVSVLAHEISLDGTIALMGDELDEVLASLNEQGASRASSSRKTFWLDAELQIDLTDERSKETCFSELQEKVLNKLPLPPFLQYNFTYEQLFLPRFLALNKAALIVLRVLDLGADCTTSCTQSLHYTAALCLPNFLLTMSVLSSKGKRTRSDQHSTFRKLEIEDTLSYMSHRELPEASSTGALSVWLLYHLNRVSDRAHTLRRKVFELDDKIDKDVASVELSEIMNVKDTFLHIMSIAEEQSECIQSLLEGQTATTAIDFRQFKGFRGLLLSTASSSERMLTRMEKRIVVIKQTFDAHQQDRINRRLAALTILSAVFLPLTLMAGIWGMNFTNMPELEREYAYYWALAGMATVAAMSLSLFRYFDWL